MKQRRVVITGIGAITPIGLGVEGLWDGLIRRESAVRCITRFDPSMFKSRIAGEVTDFSPSDHLEERRVKRLDRFSQFSVAATRMALTDARLDPAREDVDRIGAIMGTALGGVAHGERQYQNFMSGGPRAVDPALALTVFAGAASCNIAIEFGFTGPNSTNGMSCASGAIAIGEAYRAIVRGEADGMVAGGAEAPLAPGAPVYAEVCGFGLTNDAYHMTAPRPDGRQAARAMRNALGEARVAPHEVGYVNAHGSSTPLNDATETASIKQVFGDHAYRLAFSGTKGYYGHALGASGAIEAAICALASQRKWVPPTVNLS